MSLQWKSIADSARPVPVLQSRSFIFQANGTAAAMYDITPDGRRFLSIKQLGGDQNLSPQMVVVQNWSEMLRRTAPPK